MVNDFYMKVPLPDGSYTDGRVDYTGFPARLGLDKLDLTGARVLDVACNDGFWSFWAEQQGAEDVFARDVDSFEGYDWGNTEEDRKTRDALKEESKPFYRASSANGSISLKCVPSSYILPMRQP